MDKERAHPPLPHARYERFEGVRDLDAMFDELVPQTQRVIRIFDRSLSARFNTLVRCGLLEDFLRADTLNRMLIVVHDTEAVTRTIPRLVSLLQRFGDMAHLRQTPSWARHVYDPFVIFDASHYLHRFHYDQIRFARGLNEVAGARQLLDRHDELWEASTPVNAGGVTGL